jgi:uncharacterized protein (UPF0335 family)
MEHTLKIERKERERAALFEEATQIVRKAEARSKGLSVEEDASVLQLIARVRSLEEEIGHLKRSEHKRDPRRQ